MLRPPKTEIKSDKTEHKQVITETQSETVKTVLRQTRIELQSETAKTILKCQISLTDITYSYLESYK